MEASLERNTFIDRLVKSKLFWFLFCSFFFAYPLIRSLNRELPEQLPIISKVPTFKFTDENGKPFGSDDLKGRVYLASFFFTSCPTTCPRLMEKMKKIQHRVRGVGQKIALVSFSVDPEVDTPQVLFKKAREYNANPFIWKFLVGSQEKTKSLLIDGFKVPLGDREAYKDDPNVYDIVHSSRLVLVDVNGNIRGYYRDEDNSINQMMIDIGLLINRSKFEDNNKES